MDWQRSEETTPLSLIPDADARLLPGKPPATGAWREGDPVGRRRFVDIGGLTLESGGTLPRARIAYESWGTLNEQRDNAVVILHALTGDTHVTGPAEPGHPTSGWWDALVGPGRWIDTDRWYVVAPNVLGGCQGSTGPASIAPNGKEWGGDFPFLTIRDQVAAYHRFSQTLGIDRWAAVIGGSMGGMHALEWAISFPESLERVALLASPAATNSESIALTSMQIEAIRTDQSFAAGDYYEAPDGEGPYRGLALARRMALLSYRAPVELNYRFGRSWQSDVSPLGDGGRYAVESYLDFHGNRFTRRFDANSYIVLSEAMNSHDVTRGRGSLQEVLARVTARALVLGVTSDRLFPIEEQHELARFLPTTFHGERAIEIESLFSHDAFLIEADQVGPALGDLLSA